MNKHLIDLKKGYLTAIARGKAGRENVVLVLILLGYSQVEHERIIVNTHIQRLVEQNARDRLERLKVVYLQMPLAVTKLDYKQLLYVERLRVEAKLKQPREQVVVHVAAEELVVAKGKRAV